MTTATVRTATNPYLAANFGPVTEEITAFDLPVTGCLPDYLNGRYLRNGPNPVVDPDAATYHWFTGSGMVHGVRIRDGRAEWYRNRWVRAGDVAQALGEQRAPGPVHAGLDFAANTNVIGHAGRTLAIAEGGGLPYELTEGLKTVGATDLEGTLRGGYTAHPLKDPATGELHAVSYWWGHGCHVRYSVIDIAGRVRLALDVRVTGSPMMHCFSLTERFVVLYDLPVTFDVDQAVTTAPRALRPFARAAARRVIGRRRVPEPIAAPMTVRARNELFPYKWDPTHQARVGVFARKDPYPRVRWFDIAPCYVFHPLNAYDDDGCVTVDLVRHDRMFANERRGPNEGAPMLERWKISLIDGRVQQERLGDDAQEFPRVDHRVITRRHRYGYAVGFRPSSTDAPKGTSILKHDLVRALTRRVDFGPQSAVDEFVFVASSDDAAEDDGAIMGFVYDVVNDTSDLVVIEAGTLEELARVHLPQRVPHGFHGNWIADR